MTAGFLNGYGTTGLEARELMKRGMSPTSNPKEIPPHMLDPNTQGLAEALASNPSVFEGIQLSPAISPIGEQPKTGLFGEVFSGAAPENKSTPALLAGLGLGFLPQSKVSKAKGFLKGASPEDLTAASQRGAIGIKGMLKRQGMNPEDVSSLNPRQLKKVGKAADRQVNPQPSRVVEAVKNNKIKTGLAAASGASLLWPDGEEKQQNVTGEETNAFLQELEGLEGGAPVQAEGTPAQTAQAPTSAAAPTQTGLAQLVSYLEQAKASQEPNLLEKIGNTMISAGVGLNGGDPRAQHRASELPNRTPDEQAMQQIIPQLLMFQAMNEAQQGAPMSALEQAKLEQIRAKIAESQASAQYMQGLGQSF